MKKEYKYLSNMGRLVSILSEVVGQKSNKIMVEAVSKRMMQTLLNKFTKQTDDSEDTIKKYVNAFDRFKQSFPPNERDLQKYTYSDLKKIIDERVNKQKRKKEQDNILKTYMSDESLGKGMNIEDVKILLRKFYEIQPFLPKNKRDVLSLSGAELSKLISDKFSDIFEAENFKKFKKEVGGQTTDEEIMVRLERYVNGFGEVPRYTKPVHEMTFDEFEKVADVLPAVSEDETSGEIDLSDTEVVYEDDNVLIFHPDKKQKCINIRKKYAPDRGWCTSWEGSGNYYYNYRLNQNLTLYYVINKNLDLKDVNFASVILVEPYGGGMRLADGSNRGRYSGGSTIPWSEISEKIPVIADKKSLFVAKPLSDEEQQSMRDLRNVRVNSDAVKELGSEERAEQWMEITSPNLSRMTNGGIIYKNLPDDLKKKYIGLGSDLTAGMIEDSTPEVVKYLIAKKKEALMNKELGRLTDIDIALLNSPVMAGVKQKLKDKYIKDIVSVNSDEIDVQYPRDDKSKFIALYGFEDFFSSLPENIKRLDFINNSDASLNLELPPSISRFKQLETLHLQGNVIKSIPKEISELGNLVFLSLPNNQSLKTLPNEIGEKKGDDYLMSNLSILNLGDNPPGLQIPTAVREMIDNKPGFVFFE